jgi:acylphosphatase
MRVARHFLISGRVQGVGYRYFAKDAADREGVTGWVRNLPDGRVEALVEGEDEAVTRVERALRQGPGGARVSTVAVDEQESPSGAHHSFSVRG